MIDRKVLEEKINDAQLVLIGIGEEFDTTKELQENTRYLQIEEEIKNHEKYLWMIPYIQNIILKENGKIQNALENLRLLVENKNYFIVSTCMNGLVESAGFRKDRVVAPCGNYLKMQCRMPDCEHISDTPTWVYEQIGEYAAGKRSLFELSEMICPECGAVMEFNSLYSENYKEAGYMKEWGTYTKWLQGTLNKKLCVLELGVSLKFPSVIRFPFEKIAYFNQKADFIRIHEKLYQLSEELGEKGFSQSENSVVFLNRI